MNGPAVEERFAGVGEAAEQEGATCIVVGTVVVAVIENGSVVVGGTPVHPSRGW